MSMPVAAIPQIAELNIGHFLVGEAIFTGLDASVRRMRELMDRRDEVLLPERGGGPLAKLGGGGAPSAWRCIAVAALQAPLRHPSRRPLPVRGGFDDRRHRVGPVQHRAHPELARPLRRQVPQSCLHRRREAKAASRPHTTAGTLAKRFAAKEAFSKAVGTGFKRGVFMKDIGVVNLPSGAPTLQIDRWRQGAA